MRLVKLAVVVALISAVPAEAQEPPLPGGTVARVGEELVPTTEFDVWYGVFTRRSKWLAGDKPDYGRCIAMLDKRAARHGRSPSRRSLRLRCEERAQLVHDAAMEFVLDQVWVRQEAARVGVAVTLQEVARRVARLKRGDRAEFRRFLDRFGLTEAQFAAFIAFGMQRERLVDRALATIPEVTQARVRRYYAHHRHKYRHLSRDRALKRIRGRLELERVYRAFVRVERNLYRRYANVTQCAEGYVVDQCANADSAGVDEDGKVYRPSRQISTSTATSPGAGYTGAVPTTIAQPSW